MGNKRGERNVTEIESLGIPAHQLYTNNDSHLFLQPLASLDYINKSNGQLAKIKPALFPFFSGLFNKDYIFVGEIWNLILIFAKNPK